MADPLKRYFTYDIKYVHAPDHQETDCLGQNDERPRVRRVVVEDPDPKPGFGPSLGHIHRALLESAPEEFGHITDPSDIVVIRADEVGGE